MAQGFTVNHLNLGIPTAVIGRDFQTLAGQYNHFVAGNFIEQEMPFVQTTSTVVTIFRRPQRSEHAHRGARRRRRRQRSQRLHGSRRCRAFGTDYATLLAGIKTRAGAPRLVALNVPNAAGLPYLARATQAQRQAAQRIAVGDDADRRQRPDLAERRRSSI